MRMAHIHKRLMDCGYDHKVYILGIGDDQRKIEEYIEDNGLANSFIFLGYNTNPYKYVSASDMFVCASLSEGFSTAATEALILGTPVVTTRCAGMTELLGENDDYGVITENEEGALEKGIVKLLDDASLLERYRKLALERGKMFETDKTVRAVENMLENLAEDI